MSKKPPISITKMGSTVLSQSDNLTILGHHYMAVTYEEQEEGSLRESLVPAVHLDFVIMINGKTKNFGWSFFSEKVELDTWRATESQPEWMLLFNLLQKIGYQIGPTEPNDPFGWEILDDFINRVMRKDFRPE